MVMDVSRLVIAQYGYNILGGKGLGSYCGREDWVLILILNELCMLFFNPKVLVF